MQRKMNQLVSDEKIIPEDFPAEDQLVAALKNSSKSEFYIEKVTKLLVRFLPSGDKLRMVIPFSEQIGDEKFQFGWRHLDMTNGKLIGMMLKEIIRSSPYQSSATTSNILYDEINSFLEGKCRHGF